MTEPAVAKAILDVGKVTETVEKLRRRIGERFPESGLLEVGERLYSIAGQTRQRSEEINRPIWWIRMLVWAIIALIFFGGMLLPFMFKLGFSEKELTLKYFLESADPVMNEILVIGALFFFLFTAEKRVKRHRLLKAIHELRSVAHVIDMHQLTKDPERVLPGRVYVPTSLSPQPGLDQFQLRRYLDYCSEMLSLTGKLAAVYVQNFDDEVALAAVNELESLTTGLSRKIWQKIMILHNVSGNGELPATEA